MLLEAWKH